MVEDYSGTPSTPLKSLSQKGMIEYRWCFREHDKAILWLYHPSKHHLVHSGHKAPPVHEVW